jgi:hypothetical protein
MVELGQNIFNGRNRYDVAYPKPEHLVNPPRVARRENPWEEHVDRLQGKPRGANDFDPDIARAEARRRRKAAQ